jgi:hypothetical protein
MKRAVKMVAIVGLLYVAYVFVAIRFGNWKFLPDMIVTGVSRILGKP